MITFGSGCSGIEAASVAWEPLGFKPQWFAQFDPEHDYTSGPDYPSAVLQHHWPRVPNLGDLTTVRHQIELGYEAPDVFVAGTPCQAYSVAGMREGLADARGALTLEYVKILDTIDDQRQEQQKPACIGVWENVPGVLSSADNAFGCLLGGLAGSDCELEPGPRPVAGKGSRIWRWCKKTRRHLPRWTNAGYVRGPKRAIAWRILDAQYFGVAQRRRRVFVVSSARDGFDPVEVLLEFEGLRRDTPPSRETGSVVAALTANGVGTCGADDNQGQAGHLIPAIAGTLLANGKAAGSATSQDAENGLLVVHGTQDPDTNVELAHPLGRNQGQENAVCVTGDITHTLKAEGFDGSEDGTGRGTPIIPVAFAENSRQEVRLEGGDGQITGALSGGGGKVWQGYPAVVVARSVSLRGRERGATAELGDEVSGCLRASSGGGGGGDKAHVLAPAIALQTDVTPKASEELAFTLKLPSSSGGGQPAAAMTPDLAVRRLTPVECERLQGFPDGHTDVLYRGKPAADGHRYRALGNSKAIPVVAWLGKRIKKQIEYSEFDNL